MTHVGDEQIPARAAEATINWLGDVVMPVGVLAISLIVSIGIAVASANAARRAVIFQEDVRYADEFLRAIEMKHWGDLIQASRAEAYELASRMNLARVRFTSRASGSADTHLAGYLSLQERTIWAAQREYFEQLEALRAAGLGPLSAPLSIDDDAQREAVNGALSEMARMARDWPFEKRRARLLEEIAESYVRNWAKPPENHRLAVDRLLLNMQPSPFWLVQEVRRFSLWIRDWRDAIRFGRAGRRLRDWRRTRQADAEGRAYVREEDRALKAARGDAIALRKLQEQAAAYYLDRQELIPFEFVEVPEVPRRRTRRG